MVNINPTVTKAVLDRILVKGARQILVSNNAVTTGATRDSVHSQVTFTNRILTYTLLAGEGWRFIDQGRKVGKMPLKSGFKAVDNLARWKRKVGYTGSDFLLAKSINSRPIPPKFITKQLIALTRSQAIEAISALGAKQIAQYAIQQTKLKIKSFS